MSPYTIPRAASANVLRRLRPGFGSCVPDTGAVFFMLCLGLKTVADARFGQKVCGLCRIDFELLTQARDVDAHVVAAADVTRPPYFAQQGTMGEHSAGIRDKQRQQAIFDDRQVHGLVVSQDQAAREINRDVGKCNLGIAVRAPRVAPQKCAYTSDELSDSEWL